MQYFEFTSPTTDMWLALIASNRQALLDTTLQAQEVLNQTRSDVYFQFDQNQSKWTPLKEFTVTKKERLNADKRILHETKKGEGLRLRDAYAQAGRVENGEMVYFYPPSKPYAREHQEGATISSPKKGRDNRSRNPQARRIQQNQLDANERFLDEEFLRKIRFD